MNDGTLRCPHGNQAHEEPWSGGNGFVVKVADDCRLCATDGWFQLPYRTETAMAEGREAEPSITAVTVVADEAVADAEPAREAIEPWRGSCLAAAMDQKFGMEPDLPPLHEVGLAQTPKARKEQPMCRGVLDYFPDALAEVAHVSFVGNEQHNPGQPMHWAKEKSTDEADCILRHLVQRGTYDKDGLRHTGKVAWRALALLQRELDAEKAAVR